MWESGRQARLMARGHISGLMETSTRETGSSSSNTGQAQIYSPMETPSRGSTSEDGLMDGESMYGTMELNMWESSGTGSSTGRGTGQRVTTARIILEPPTKESTGSTRNGESGPLPGLRGTSTMESM